MDLTMPPTEVPAVETTYMCTAFTFSDDVIAGDFHTVGIETIVGNVDILHHIQVYGCPDETGTSSVPAVVDADADRNAISFLKMRVEMFLNRYQYIFYVLAVSILFCSISC